MTVYSKALPKMPEPYTVRVFTPDFLSAGTTWFLCKSSHSLSISGFTRMMVTSDRSAGDSKRRPGCAKQGAIRKPPIVMMHTSEHVTCFIRYLAIHSIVLVGRN